jgi:hypothetical protein
MTCYRCVDPMIKIQTSELPTSKLLLFLPRNFVLSFFIYWKLVRSFIVVVEKVLFNRHLSTFLANFDNLDTAWIRLHTLKHLVHRYSFLFDSNCHYRVNVTLLHCCFRSSLIAFILLLQLEPTAASEEYIDYDKSK